MRIDTLFWLLIYVLVGSVVVFGAAKVALWYRKEKQAREMEQLTRQLEEEDRDPREDR